MKTIKHDPAQLLLELPDKGPIQRTVDKLGKAVVNLEKAEASAREALATMRDAARQFTDSQSAVVSARKTVNRIVGVLATQYGLDYHTVWVLVYHEHFKRTGFHAVAASRGVGTHLDAVERAGQMGELEKTVSSLLTDGGGLAGRGHA